LLSSLKQDLTKAENNLVIVVSQLIFFGGTCKFLISLWHEKLLRQHRFFPCIYFLGSFFLFIVLTQFGKHISMVEPTVVDALKYLIAGFCSAFIGLILEKHRSDKMKVDQ
jgi:hypothetical protein